jgi:hypothetical protein
LLSAIRVFAGGFGGATPFHDTNLVPPSPRRRAGTDQIGFGLEEILALQRNASSATTAPPHVLANAAPGHEPPETFRQSDEALFA